jgi:hypothetical protein
MTMYDHLLSEQVAASQVQHAERPGDSTGCRGARKELMVHKIPMMARIPMMAHIEAEHSSAEDDLERLYQ